MLTNTSFWMYMGQHGTITDSEFEPARRREILLGELADTQCAQSASGTQRTSGRTGFGSLALNALTAGRRLVRG